MQFKCKNSKLLKPQCGPRSNGSEGVPHIPQSSSNTGTSPSDCLVSYQGHLLGEEVLLLCRDAVGVFYSPWAKIMRGVIT